MVQIHTVHVVWPTTLHLADDFVYCIEQTSALKMQGTFQLETAAASHKPILQQGRTWLDHTCTFTAAECNFCRSMGMECTSERSVLQVNSVSFFEHHTLDGDHQASGAGVPPHNIRRLCVMETEVTNRTEGPLQVNSCPCLYICLSTHSLWESQVQLVEYELNTNI